MGNTQSAREILFYEAVSTIAIRDGDWKYIPASKPTQKDPKFLKRKGLESGLSYEPQLYNLAVDPGEVDNLAIDNPDKINDMQRELDTILNR